MIHLSAIDPIRDTPIEDVFTLMIGSTPPTGLMAAGILYYDSTNGVLYGYVGNQGVNVAPSLTINVGRGITWNSLTADGNLFL